MKSFTHRLPGAVSTFWAHIQKNAVPFIGLFFLFVVSRQNALAQASSANYTFATNTSAALNLDLNSNTVDMTTGTTQISSSSVDQGVNASAITIGFEFWLMGNRYTQFNATTNGLVSLSSTGTSASSSTYVVSGGTVTTPIISAFAADLGTGTSGKTHYKVVGTAPNRCLVVEFNNMTLYWTGSYANDGTYQVRLYETTGVIEFVYGAMSITSSGSASDATAGIGFATNTTTNNLAYVTTSSNSSTVTAPFTDNPTYPAGAIANLNSPTEGSRRVYRFTPPVPAAPTGLNFTGVGGTVMTLNWTDNATNEVGYAIYRSTDNVNFTYVTTTAANATSYNATGLNFSTTYYWNVYAVSEGAISSALSGNQMTNGGSLSGDKTIGPSGDDYASLTAAFTAINANGLAGNINLILQSDYVSTVETFPLTTCNSTPVGPYTVTVYPAATGLSITSANASGTLLFNNGKNIVFDGRVNATGTTKDLVIENTNTSGYTISFANDATSNTVKYCVVKGVNNLLSSGVIVFGSTTGTNGNDNNTIDNNDIRDGATTPTYCIYASGNTTSTTHNNSGVTISNNNIFNFFAAGMQSGGIVIVNGNTDWTISSNSIYQTATRTSTSGNTHYGIQISNTSGNNFSITGNYIGGGAAGCGGTPWTQGGVFANRFQGISLSVGTTTATSVQNNTIANFSWSSSSGATTLPAVWIGIYCSAGNANIGTTTGNTIGAGTGTGSVVVTVSTTGGVTAGIGSASTGTVSISNNNIGSITLLGSSASISHSFNGIWATSGANTISGNTIGSTSTSNSINANNASTSTTAQVMAGIRTTSSTSSTITNNTIANFNNSYSPSSANTNNAMLGISNNAGVVIISGNTVRNFACGSQSTGTSSSASVIGISQTSTTAPMVVSQNAVHSLTNSQATAAVAVTGIHIAGPTTGSNLVARNNVHSLAVFSTSATADIHGIYFASGLATVQNNMIRLGFNAAGAALTTGISIIGLHDATSTTNTAMLHNSVYIGGSGVGTQTGNTFAFRSDQTVNTRIYQNNIFINARSNAGAGGKHYAVQVSGTGFNPTGLNINYNLYQATGTGGVLGLYSAVDRTTLCDWRNATGQDGSSAVGDPNFVNATGDANAVDLHVTGTTPAEAGGNSTNTVTDDFDGATRAGLTPVDLGADAGNFTGSDLFPPSISYTALGNRTSSNTTLTGFATITDNVGVSTGANLPRFYYKKSTDANAFVGNTSADNGWKYVVASNSSSPFNFTIDYSIINGGSVAAGNIIQYFVVAQDDANNLGSRQGCATSSANPPVQNINGAPTTTDQFTIVNGIGGTVNVGTGQTYTSLTLAGGLFDAINNALLTGNVTANITSDLSGEIGTISLNQWNEEPSSSNYTLTIQPSGGALRTVTGAGSTAIINLNGADRVTIDGLNTGGNALTFSNTSTSGATIRLINDATNNTVKNCTLQGVTTSATNGVVTISTGASTGNDNNTFTGNTIRDGATAPVNGFYAAGTAGATNNNITITNNSIFNWTTNGVTVTSTGNGDNWNISNNSFYQTASRTTTLTAISLASAANGNTVNNNSIGGSDASRGGTAMTSSSGFVCISLAVGTTTATEVQGNNIGNLVSTNTGSSHYGIFVSAGNVNIGTTSGNFIGGTAANDITVANSLDGISSSSTGIVDIQNNTVRNLKYDAADFERLSGIYITAGTATIKNNTIRDLLHKGTSTSTTATSFCPWGIRIASTTSGNLIEGNTIYNLSLDFNGASNASTYPMYGIAVTGAVTGTTVTRNRIYNLTTTRTGTGSSAPLIFGIYANAGAATYSNNQVSIVNTVASTQPFINGIQLESTGNNNFYYNSVYVGGTAAASNSTYCFYRASSSGTQTLRNNLFYNERGGSGNHFAIGTASTTGWSTTISSDYSTYISANSANIANWAGTANTFATWKTNTGGDRYSHADVNTNAGSANLFVDKANGDLNINTANIESWYVAGKGVQISGLTADYGSTAAGRPTTVPQGATDIGSDEIGTPAVAPHVATQTGTLAVGNTTTYSFAGRDLVNIAWITGTVPSSVTMRYYSGETPPDATCSNPAALYSDAYWDITPDVTSGYTFDLTIAYTPAILGTIAAEADCILSENETNCWHAYPGSTVNTTTKTVTEDGITSFSKWTLTSSLSPLPITLGGINAFAKGSANRVEWYTLAELNADLFVVERSSNGIQFHEIGTVNAVGNANGAQYYGFDDQQPVQVSYYRLRMIDNDGSFQYSPTVVVTRKTGGFAILSAFPSPTEGDLNLNLEALQEGPVTLRITDMTGHIVLEQTFESEKGLNLFQLDLSALPGGVYQVNALLEGGESSRPYRIIKQ